MKDGQGEDFFLEVLGLTYSVYFGGLGIAI